MLPLTSVLLVVFSGNNFGIKCPIFLSLGDLTGDVLWIMVTRNLDEQQDA